MNGASAQPKYSLGDKVQFILAPDIKAVVTDISIISLQVAWFNNSGDRLCYWIDRLEVEPC